MTDALERIFFIFRYYNYLMTTNQWDMIDYTLETKEIRNVALEECIVILRITYMGRRKLQQWNIFRDKVIQHSKDIDMFTPNMFKGLKDDN